MPRSLSPERRQAYLDAALHLFTSQGVQNTTTADIARAAGTASGTLFLYFPTRQELINALALDIAARQAEALGAALLPGQPARQTFAAIWEGSIRWLLENPEAFRFAQLAREPGLLPPEVVAQTGAIFQYYYAAVQKGLQEGSIKPYSPDLIGGMLYQAIAAVMLLASREEDPNARADLIRQGFEIFWNGIRS